MGFWKPLGAILQEKFSVAASAVEEALRRQSVDGRRLGELMMEAKAISPRTLAAALSEQTGLPLLETVPTDQAGELIPDIPIAFAKEHSLFPVCRQGNLLRVAVADPFDGDPLNDLAVLTGNDLELVLAPPEEILKAINLAYERQSGKTDEIIEEIGSGRDLSAGLEPADLIAASDEAPVIRFVNSMVTQGYKERASDIHIEPFEKDLLVRYRVDGILYEILRPPLKAHGSIVSRIKIMAGLNIAEKRLPQDGRFRVRIAGKDLDIRVSTLPTAFGERVVLRLLDKSAGLLSLEQIGMDGSLLGRMQSMITRSHGIFLVTGPTGSGKTTTLYSALSRINNQEKNIITVEDPIEYQLPGVGQIQVNPKIGLTFATGLRSILRQDPDIIMVGEIRDGETAEIAVQSALTGHLVFSTLHTNDAASALSRLVEMGVEPFLAASSILGILAQRLVRTICPDCRKAYAPDEALLSELAVVELPPDARFYRGEGCERCLGTGYRGRTGIYELLSIDDRTRELVLQNKDSVSIKDAAVAAGMTPLREAGLAKALAGITTIEEVLRVTQEEL